MTAAPTHAAVTIDLARGCGAGIGMSADPMGVHALRRAGIATGGSNRARPPLWFVPNRALQARVSSVSRALEPRR